MGRELPEIIKIAMLLVIIAFTTGCASSGQVIDSSDPIESTNRKSFSLNETLDKHLMKPVAEVYVDITPAPVRAGVTNFFDNLIYLNVILNGLLQGKFDQGIQDTLRFVYNSTFGIGGLFDVATAWGMPKHYDDLGQTLAVWGFAQGAYLTVPVYGPNTVRNLPDLATSILLYPFTYATGIILYPISALYAINYRANLLEASNIRDEAALDPYSFTREAYLQQRKYMIYDGNPPTDEYDNFFDEIEGEGEGESGVLVIE